MKFEKGGLVKELEGNEADELLFAIPTPGAGEISRDDWFYILKSYKGAGGDVETFKAWCNRNTGYKNDADAAWKSASPDMTPDNLVALARENGWTPEKYYRQNNQRRQTYTPMSAPAGEQAQAEPETAQEVPERGEQAPAEPAARSAEEIKLSNDEFFAKARKAKPKITYPKLPGSFSYYASPKEVIAEGAKHTQEPEFRRWLASRGIDDDVAEKWHIGYIPDFLKCNKDNKDNPTKFTCELSDRAIFPFPEAEITYTAARRMFRAVAFVVDAITHEKLADADLPSEKYEVQPKTLVHQDSKKGGKQLYNLPALLSDDRVCFIVEGQIDCITVETAGYRCIAVNEDSQLTPEIEKAVKGGKDFSRRIFAIIPDRDRTGADKGFNVEAALDRQKCKSYKCEYVPGCKDINELWCTDREAARKWLKGMKEKATQKLDADVWERNAAQHLAKMRERLADPDYNRPVSTGFSQIDNWLGGGIFPGLYMIGGESSCGKTAFSLQVASHVAEEGTDVLYFSLEMSAEELISRDVSRLTMMTSTNQHDWKTSTDLRRPYKIAQFSASERRCVDDAYKYYEARIAPHFFIHEAMGDVNAEVIEAFTKSHAEATGKVPMVVIDYCQLMVAPFEERTGHASMGDKQVLDFNMLELKRLSRDLHCIVWGISSVSRGAYGRGFEMGNYKESGAIEFTSDCCIGLQYRNVVWGDTPTKIERAKAQAKIEEMKAPRELSVICEKNRNGMKRWGDNGVAVDYYSKFNYFEEVPLDRGVYQCRQTTQKDEAGYKL